MTEAEFRAKVDLIKDRINIKDIIGEYIDLNQSNMGVCPFHDDTNPSMSVNEAEHYYNCFGCDAGGDVIDFIMRMEKIGFMEALSRLAADAGVDLPDFSQEDEAAAVEARTILCILAETARFYQESLTEEARNYLIERGLSSDTISRYQIGYASGGLASHLVRDCGYDRDLCVKAGVLKRDEDGSVRNFFQNRIIFPNHKRGRVVHMSGRAMNDTQPKYLHLPGRIEHLFNEDALSNESVFVVEGILDCLSMEQNGFPAVAILGTNGLKEEWLDRFQRCKTVNICLDGDRAGREGGIKAAGFIGEKARIVSLPEGVDPNEFFREHSPDDLRKLIDESVGVVRFLLRSIPKDADRAELPELLAPVLDQVSRVDKVRTEVYLGEIKSQFGMSSKEVDGYRDEVTRLRRLRTGGPLPVEVEEMHPVYSARIPGLVDIVLRDDKPAFLMKEGGELRIEDSVEVGGVHYLPPPREQIPWLLPRGDEVLRIYEAERNLPHAEVDSALHRDIVGHLKEISDLPDEEFYPFLACWIMHTYLLETVSYSPIIALFAVPERGKSRTGKGLIYLAYRGIHVESLRDAYIVRMASGFQATIFFDVLDIWKKAEKSGAEDILLHRCEKGAKVPRVLYPERGPHQDIVYYEIFGPTIIATNEAMDRILETRAVQLNMPSTTRRFDNDVKPELALPLKERLLAFRARHLDTALPEAPKPAHGRLGDILRPILQIIRLVKPDQEESFLKLVEQLQSERQIEKADSLEAQILRVMIRLEDEVEHGILPVKRITDYLNFDKEPRYQFTPHRIGRRLSAMGFQKSRTGDGAAAVIYNQELIEQLKPGYGL